MKTLIVCDSRYGSTLEIGYWMSERIGNCDVFNVGEAPVPDSYDFVILGAGVYQDSVDKGILKYAADHQSQLAKTAVFATCLDTRGVFVCGKVHGGWSYLDKLLDQLADNPPLHADLLGGELNPNELTKADNEMLLFFYNKILKRGVDSVPFVTKMNKQQVWDYAEKVLAVRGQ